MLLSLVFPVFNEEDALPHLLSELAPVLNALDCEHEMIFVDDGSRDATRSLLAEAAAHDPRIKVLGFSRNFGHQAAITAGLDFASGDAVVVMDADLQDPPALLPEMVALYRQGYDVVSAQRAAREGEGVFKRATAALFYGLMRRAVDCASSAASGRFPPLQPRGGDRDSRTARAASLPAWDGGMAWAPRGHHPVPTSSPRGRHHQVPGLEDGPLCLDGNLLVLSLAAQAESRRGPLPHGLRARLFRVGSVRSVGAQDHGAQAGVLWFASSSSSPARSSRRWGWSAITWRESSRR